MRSPSGCLKLHSVQVWFCNIQEYNETKLNQIALLNPYVIQFKYRKYTMYIRKLLLIYDSYQCLYIHANKEVQQKFVVITKKYCKYNTYNLHVLLINNVDFSCICPFPRTSDSEYSSARYCLHI